MKGSKVARGSKVLMGLILSANLLLIAQPVLAGGSQSEPQVARSSCANPSSVYQGWWCNEQERQILASTVRLEWVVGNQHSFGHGTVKQGRYVVTHNHTSIVSFSPPTAGAYVLIYRANGQLIWQAALEDVDLVVADSEALVLDLGNLNGVGLFDALGISSARFTARDSLNLQAGMEVAQIDWNGAVAHIDWAAIESVGAVDGTPVLELGNYVQQGASGGGIFWNGTHIANNWYRTQDVDGNSGTVLREYTVVALNSDEATAPMVVRSSTQGMQGNQPNN